MIERLAANQLIERWLNAIALDSSEMLLVLCRQELALLKMQREDDLTQIENNPEHIRKIKSQAKDLKTNADAIALAIETTRKIIGEPITGTTEEKEIAVAAISTGTDQGLSKEIDRLLQRREQLAKRIRKIQQAEDVKKSDPA